MSTLDAWAMLASLGLGAGLWLIASRTPRMRAPRLIDRIAPFVTDVSHDARERVERHTVDPLPLLGLGLSPVLRGLQRGIRTLLGPADALALRLRQAGGRTDVEAFRLQQVSASVLGALTLVAVMLASPPLRALPLVVQLAMPVLGAVAGYCTREGMLRRSIRARLGRILRELPTTLEFLALSLAAGEGISPALRRITRTGKGELALALGAVVAETTTGVPLPVALRRLEGELRLPALGRAIEATVAALEHGSPLSDVLLAQANDARLEQKRELLEIAGKKELAMLVPLVFLILPVTVLFAVYPGLFVLQSGMSG